MELYESDIGDDEDMEINKSGDDPPDEPGGDNEPCSGRINKPDEEMRSNEPGQSFRRDAPRDACPSLFTVLLARPERVMSRVFSERKWNNKDFEGRKEKKLTNILLFKGAS